MNTQVFDFRSENSNEALSNGMTTMTRYQINVVPLHSVIALLAGVLIGQFGNYSFFYTGWSKKKL